MTQEALMECLSSGGIAGAGLDVMRVEPLPPSHPLASCPNSVLTPHMGSATQQARDAMASLAVDNLLAGIHGKEMPANIK